MTSLDGVTLLFVPGLRDHVAEHWQTLLAAEIPGSITVEPLTEDRLSRQARVKALDDALSGIEGEVVIAAHSAGALMVANWALAPTRPIRGALLATPADVENPLPPGYPAYDDLKANGWLPIPREPRHSQSWRQGTIARTVRAGRPGRVSGAPTQANQAPQSGTARPVTRQFRAKD